MGSILQCRVVFQFSSLSPYQGFPNTYYLRAHYACAYASLTHKSSLRYSSFTMELWYIYQQIFLFSFLILKAPTRGPWYCDTAISKSFFASFYFWKHLPGGHVVDYGLWKHLWPMAYESTYDLWTMKAPTRGPGGGLWVAQKPPKARQRWQSLKGTDSWISWAQKYRYVFSTLIEIKGYWHLDFMSTKIKGYWPPVKRILAPKDTDPR